MYITIIYTPIGLLHKCGRHSTVDSQHKNLETFLHQDELRHVSPLKMLGLYREHFRVVTISAGDELAYLMLSPRAASQWDTANYPSASLVIYPVLSASPSAALIDVCARAILEQAGAESFVVKTCDLLLISALRTLRPALTYQRALCTFTPDAIVRNDPDGATAIASIQMTNHIPASARALVAAHDVYSDSELATMFADGSARCLLSFGDDESEPAAIALIFPNTRTLHEIGSLYVAPHVRRAGHASALVRAALTDVAARNLAVRYLVDATNVPSITLAQRCGLREVMGLEHWLAE
jgi:ribosomal protein S18 acetylase RimI-like enzyme